MMMRRRSLLAGLAAAAAVPAIAWPRFPAFAALTRTMRRVRPSDPAWPGAASWQKLKDAVGGNLVEVQSLFGDCPAEPNGPSCVDAKKNVRNPFYLGDQAGGTQVSGWLDAWTPAPSAYAIEARSAADVQTAVDFARVHHLRLAVKGTGHDYLGRSSAADSLLVWTHGMRGITVHDAFVADGCDPATAVPAMTVEAGARWLEATAPRPSTTATSRVAAA